MVIDKKSPELDPALGEGKESGDPAKETAKIEKDLADANAEIKRLTEIKAKMAEDQAKKNRLKASLRGENELLKAQLDTIESKLQGFEKELIPLREEAKATKERDKTELETLMKAIPEDKKSFLDDVTNPLAYIKKHYAHFFGQEPIGSQVTNPFSIPAHGEHAGAVVLTPEETDLIQGKLTQEDALEAKRRDPGRFKLIISKLQKK